MFLFYYGILIFAASLVNKASYYFDVKLSGTTHEFVVDIDGLCFKVLADGRQLVVGQNRMSPLSIG